MQPTTFPDQIAQRYRVLGTLGRGAMGEVYRVADTLQGDREVALKRMLPAGPLSADALLRFKEEYRAMAKLRHPNTIAVHDFGQLDAQTTYLTMALVPGHELAELIAGRGLPLDQVYAYLAQLLHALAFIHARGYVHRDIKSQNIRVTPEGRLVLMDFGLMDQLGRPTRGGKICGSPGYMPPEAITGGVIDASSDLYSVGCLAFELVVGKLPFEGGLREVLRAHATEPAPRVRHFRPEAPEALERLVDRLLAKDPAARYGRAAEVLADLAPLAGAGLVTPDLDQRRSFLASAALVGREAELARLEALLTRALGGHGAAVLVGAPAGTGKSRLVQEFLLQARLADAIVLEGRCREGAMAPYEPLIEALRPLVGHTPPAEAARLAPVLGGLWPELGAPAPGPADPVRVGEAVLAWLGAVAARRPVVFCLDDLHWCDERSLDVFNRCARGAAALPLVAIATLRDDELGPSAPQWRCVADGQGERLTLAPFDRPQLALLLAALLRDYTLAPTIEAELFRVTGGNPFFVTEVLRDLVEGGLLAPAGGTWRFPPTLADHPLPASIEAAVLRRLARLGPGARDLAGVAAVLGKFPARDLMRHAGGLAEEALFERLDELVERHFMVRDQGGYAFPHDRVREALYAHLGEEERRALHHRCALAIEALRDPADGATIASLAYHHARGTDRDQAYRYVRAAAEHARDTGSRMTAMAFWQEADRILAAMPADAERERRQAELWWALGSQGTLADPEYSIGALERLIPLLEAKADADRISRWLARGVQLIQRLPAALRGPIMARLTTPKPYVHRVTGRPDVAAWLPHMLMSYGFLGAACAFVGRPVRGLELAERALALFPFPGTPLGGALLIPRCTNLFQAGRLDELAGVASEAYELVIRPDADGTDRTMMLARAASAGYMEAMAWQGIAPTFAHLEAEAVRSEALGDASIVNDVRHWRAAHAAFAGRQEAALAYVAGATKRCRDADHPDDPYVLYLRPLLLAQDGEHEAALAALERARAAAHVPAGGLMGTLIRILLADQLRALGRLDEAEAALVEPARLAAERSLGQAVQQAGLVRARIALARGARAEARRELEAVRSAVAAGPLRNPLVEQQALHGLAEADPERALAYLDAALAVCATIDVPIEVAHIQLARARVLGRHDEARRALDAAKAGYMALGNARGLAQVEAALPAPAVTFAPNTHLARRFMF